MCPVCKHPKRAVIEAALEKPGATTTSVARDWQIPRATLHKHRALKHRDTVPYEPRTLDDGSLAPPEKDPFPDSADIANMKDGKTKASLLFRYFAERRYKGAKTVAYLARIWRRQLGDDAEEKVAEMAAKAALRRMRLRGPRHLKKEELHAKAEELHDCAKKDGKYDAALNALKFAAELDGLLLDPGMVRELIEAHAIRAILPIVRARAPEAEPEIRAAIERIDVEWSRAKETVDDPVLVVEAEAERYIDVTSSDGQAAEREHGRCVWVGCGALADLHPIHNDGTIWDVCAAHEREGRERGWWKNEPSSEPCDSTPSTTEDTGPR